MKRTILLALSLLLLAYTGLGQPANTAQSNRPKTILIGTVYDVNRAVIAGAQVVARDTSGEDYEATTSGEGVYSFELPVGIYKVEANADGFCPKRANNFRVTDGVLDFVLTIRDETHRCKQQSMLKRQPETKRSEIPKQIAE